MKEYFPFFKQNPDFTYLDTAATAQKPAPVIERLTRYYTSENANVHRGMYRLAQEATEAYENSRDLLKKHLNAAEREEIIFTRGTTEGLNLLASVLSRGYLKKGEGILISGMEHHSNLVPWQQAADEKDLTLHFIDFDRKGNLLWDEFRKNWPENIKLVSLTMMSHVFGTETPFKEIIAEAHKRGALVILDAAQAAPRRILDVQDTDCDFLVLSGHKLYGPSGIGVLYGKKRLLESLPVWQTGGDMIQAVWREKSTWNDLPWRFEAGTPPIAQAIGLGEAVSWLGTCSFTRAVEKEEALTQFIRRELSGINGLIQYGESDNGIISFNLGQIHAHDLGQYLDSCDVAVRTGHHCAHPVMRQLGIASTVRASLGIYSDQQDAERFLSAVKKAREYFGKYGL